MQQNMGGRISKPHKNLKSVVGQRFGKQVVTKDEGGGYVTIQCDCGTIKETRKQYITNGQSKSCGCGRYASKYGFVVGSKFSMLTVVQLLPSSGIKRQVLAICECGTHKVFNESDLVAGSTKSCGCFRKTRMSALNKGHGESGKRRTYLYRAWVSMRARCKSPKRYPSYAGRGIKVCPEWDENYEAFRDYVRKNLKERPPGHSLDRIDNDGNYEPGNIRWAPDEVQARNRSSNKYVTIGDETKCVADWADEFGVGRATAAKRLKKGMAPDKAFNKRREADSLTVNGDTRTIKEWSEIYGVSVDNIRKRLKKGWDPYKAVSKPTNKWGSKITVDGETHSVDEWAKVKGIQPDLIYLRIRRGWEPDRAVSTPPANRGQNR